MMKTEAKKIKKLPVAATAKPDCGTLKYMAECRGTKKGRPRPGMPISMPGHLLLVRKYAAV